MSLKEKIREDLTASLKNRQKLKTSTLRLVTAAITMKEKEGEQKEIDDEAVQKILQTLTKQRKDAIELYTKGERFELAEKEKRELEMIEPYLPEKISSDQILETISDVIDETGAATMKDMGKVMGAVMKQLKETGKIVDGTDVITKVKQALSGEETD